MDYGLNERVAIYISNTITVITIILISAVVDFIIKRVVLAILEKYIKRSINRWDDILLENRVFERAAHMIPALIIYLFASAFPAYKNLIQRIVFAWIIFIIILTFNSFINAIEHIYWKFEISKTKPIKGYLQVIQIFTSIMGVIIIISVIIDRSPKFLLSGIGAATAVLLLIFQNSILGLVASIQLSSNDMVKIGDWISMPKYDADGDVLDISLHTVKVQNWDKTIVTIPTYALVSESFKNWRGMQESGGRRIKRSIYIDMTSIKFCDGNMLERFEKIEYLKGYLESKKKEIETFNKERNIDTSNIVNGRHLTNIGIFRVYVEEYLKNHPKINKNMLQIVRQLQPTENGLPIEIYTFTNDTGWVFYEGVQSDIFDHILAVVPEFDLRVYQAPTGHDLKGKLLI